MRLSRVRGLFRQDSEELNITAFMNLMVILVPFLLITAVFSQMSVLRLDIPSDKQSEAQQAPTLQLEVLVRKDALYLQEANQGLISLYKWENGVADWKAFGAKLAEIKKRFPKEEGIALLVSPDIDYQELVTVMDHVSSTVVEDGESKKTIDLFPAISVGDAPAATPEGAAQ